MKEQSRDEHVKYGWFRSVSVPQMSTRGQHSIILLLLQLLHSEVKQTSSVQVVQVSSKLLNVKMTNNNMLS